MRRPPIAISAVAGVKAGYDIILTWRELLLRVIGACRVVCVVFFVPASSPYNVIPNGTADNTHPAVNATAWFLHDQTRIHSEKEGFGNISSRRFIDVHRSTFAPAPSRRT